MHYFEQAPFTMKFTEETLVAGNFGEISHEILALQ